MEFSQLTVSLFAGPFISIFFPDHSEFQLTVLAFVSVGCLCGHFSRAWGQFFFVVGEIKPTSTVPCSSNLSGSLKFLGWFMFRLPAELQASYISPGLAVTERFNDLISGYWYKTKLKKESEYLNFKNNFYVLKLKLLSTKI